VPLGDRTARLELLESSPSLDSAARGFLAGRNAPDDVPGMIRMFRLFHASSLWHPRSRSGLREMISSSSCPARAMSCTPRPWRALSMRSRPRRGWRARSGSNVDAIDFAVVESIQRIASQMGIQTVAEGVESEAALKALAAIGVDFVQGYHLHRPAPLTEIVRLLRQRADDDVRAVAITEQTQA
jgi:hypothetical protein